MLPHYQNRTLNYDVRIKEQINKRLKKKYANVAPVNFTANNPDAEALFGSLEKTLFLIFALLQEAQTYLFQVGNHASDIADNRSDYTVPSYISYSDDGSYPAGGDPSAFRDVDSDNSSFFDRPSQFAMRQANGDPYDYGDEDSSIASSFRGNNNNITTAQKVVSTIGQFRSVLSRILQTAPSFNNLVKQITPLFNYLSQNQVDTLRMLMGEIIDLFQELNFRVLNELNETGRDKAELVKVVGLISEKVVGSQFTLLANLIRSYNPVVVPIRVAGINDTGSGYSIADGMLEGQYV